MKIQIIPTNIEKDNFDGTNINGIIRNAQKVISRQSLRLRPVRPKIGPERPEEAARGEDMSGPDLGMWAQKLLLKDLGAEEQKELVRLLGAHT